MRLVLMIISLLIVGGCGASHQSVVTDTDVDDWHDSEFISMENSDTTTLRDIDLFVRYSPSLVDDSVALIIKTISPDSIAYDESVTLRFDKSPSERGASRIAMRPYRKRVVWSELGVYNLEVTPSSTVKGIEAIGVNITKHNNK